MPRHNPARAIGAEANLAARISRELNQRGWSPAELARRMTAAGCSIQTSAVYKIIGEDSTRRRISVDELEALSRVFDRSKTDLLTDVEVIDQQRAQELVHKVDDAEGRLADSSSDLVNGCWELLTMAADNKDRHLYEYVVGHLWGDTKRESPPEIVNLGTILAAGFDAHPEVVRGDVLRYLDQAMDRAKTAAANELTALTGDTNAQH